MGQKRFHLVYICISKVVEIEKNTDFKVQKSLISLFLHHDRGEVIATRQAEGHSYRNAVKMCQRIANLGV